MCVVLTKKEKKRRTRMRVTGQRERKEEVDCVIGSGVRWGARGNQNNLITQFWLHFFYHSISITHHS